MTKKELSLHSLATPIGRLILGAVDNKICLCCFEEALAGEQERLAKHNIEAAARRGGDPILVDAAALLTRYFRRRPADLSGLPLCLLGTEFQKKAWRQMRKVKAGQTTTYGEVAAALGKPNAGRAVGAACRENPVTIIVPCHRVVGRSGLVGYSAGVERKRFLLELEGGSNF